MSPARIALPTTSASINAAASRDVIFPRMQSGATTGDFFDTRPDITKDEPHHAFAGLIILLGLELLAPALLVRLLDLGSLNAVIPGMTQLFTALALAGGAVTLVGALLLMRSRHHH